MVGYILGGIFLAVQSLIFQTGRDAMLCRMPSQYPETLLHKNHPESELS